MNHIIYGLRTLMKIKRGNTEHEVARVWERWGVSQANKIGKDTCLFVCLLRGNVKRNTWEVGKSPVRLYEPRSKCPPAKGGKNLPSFSCRRFPSPSCRCVSFFFPPTDLTARSPVDLRSTATPNQSLWHTFLRLTKISRKISVRVCSRYDQDSREIWGPWFGDRTKVDIESQRYGLY